ncbi:MAG: hypothetical protein ACE5FS_02245 [Paracoccaceae bacterium]
MNRLALFLAVSVFSATSALAQSSVGFRTGELRVSASGFAASRGGNAGVSGALGLRGDFEITPAHGLQLDLDYDRAGQARIGTLAGHLYLLPRENRKYGLFFSYGDFDGNAFHVLQTGAEGIFTLGSGYLLDGHAGIGVRQPGSLDYVFAGAGLTRMVGRAGSLRLGLDIADFDESAFSTTFADASVGFKHALAGTPAVLSLSVGGVAFDGSASDRSGLYARLGLVIRLGRAPGAAAAGHLFRRSDPLGTLYRSGVF